MLALGLLAGSAHPWSFFGEPSDGRIRPYQALSDSNKAAQVVAGLTPEFIESLRGTDLRQAYVLLGDNLYVLGRRDEALAQYQVGLSLFPRNVDLLTREAGLLHRNEMDERAKPLFLQALQIEPKHWGAHIGLAEIERGFGFPDRAAAHYKIALESAVVAKREDVWEAYAETLLDLGKSSTAETALRKALEIAPSSARAHILLGLTRRAQGDLHEAAIQFGLAAKLGGGIGAMRCEALVFLEAGRLSEAWTKAQDVLAVDSLDAAGLWVAARVDLARGRTNAAEAALRKIVSVGGFSGRAAAEVLKSLGSA